MIEPPQRFLDGLDGRHRGQGRAAQQDDGQAERARRRDLAEVAVPPLFLATTMSIACMLSKSRSSASVNGPRPVT